MLNGYARAMTRYVRFEGRASRAEFWQFIAGVAILVIVGRIIDSQIAKEQGEADEIVTALISCAHLLPALAVTVRRLHDTNRTGWWILLNCVPPLNLVNLVFACQRGTMGPNSYGLDPNTADGAPPGDVVPATSAAALPPASPVRTDVIAELERLGRLRREGHLSEAEFEVMKSETLAHARR